MDGEQAERCAFEKYIENLFKAAEADYLKSGKDLLIFFHGGLNTRSTSTKRANKLIELYRNDHEGDLGNYYPILINWDSGFFESYGEHLFEIRQGKTNKLVAIPTSPLYFAADAGRGLVRAPIDILSTSYHDLQTIPWFQDVTSKSKTNSEIIYTKLNDKFPENISRGRKLDWGLQTFYKVPINIFTWPFQIAFSPIIDAFGKPAWDNMKRRTKILYNNPDEFDIDAKTEFAESAIEGLPPSVMLIFVKELRKYTEKYPTAKITLVGHSMGAFIINELVRKYPDITSYQNIIYMAGADSIRNTFNSIMPYLKNNKDKKVKFYNLTLHPQNEVEEPNWYFLPRGSLLVWIDDFFSIPATLFDRSVGRWENIIQAYGEIPEEVRDRVFIKAFDQTSEITEHGDFSKAIFWSEQFWKPGDDDCNPWPVQGKGFYTEQ